MMRIPGARTSRSRNAGGGLGIRLIIGIGLAIFALFSYLTSSQYNEVTGENQHISITTRQEIALGLQSEPEMIRQYGGLHPDQRLQDFVDEVGFKLVNSNPAVADSEYQYEFHLLADPNTVNAFALPGGRVFITMALFSRLDTEGQLAGILGHEIGHVVARHGAQRIAKNDLTQGLAGAVMVGSGNASAGQAAAMIAQLVNMQYGRGDEIQSDVLGVQFMVNAGYDPRGLVGVMQILEAATGGARQPEFFSTHPNPENRIARIEEAIAEIFPNGVPDGLIP